MILKDKVALVTGGSRGIGKAIAIELGKAGAKVAVNYSRSAAEAEAVVEDIKALGGDAFAVKASVDNSEEVATMFKAIEEQFGGVDILVNNAGITKDGLLIRMKDEDWQSVMDVNLKGAFVCIKHASKNMMKKRYGKIINLSSVVGFSGNPGQINYSASKAGMIGMTKSAALELAGKGVRVNAVAPGFIDTDMTSVLSEDIRKAMVDNVPLKSVGSVSDVAAAVLYLASPASDYITGQTIHINGGLYM